MVLGGKKPDKWLVEIELAELKDTLDTKIHFLRKSLIFHKWKNIT